MNVISMPYSAMDPRRRTDESDHHAACSQCEEIFDPDVTDEIAQALGTCGERECIMGAIAIASSHTAKWTAAKPLLERIGLMEASMFAGKLEEALLALSLFREQARQVLDWRMCSVCGHRRAVKYGERCGECEAIGHTEQFHG